MENWRKIQRLSMMEWWCLCQSLLLLPVNALFVSLLGLKRSQRILLFLTKSVESLVDDRGTRLAQIYQVARMVDWASRYGVFNANCLHRSLTLWWLLKRLGIDSDLKIGVRLLENQFQAHAWVEYLGDIINDSLGIGETFQPFAGSFDLNGRRDAQ